jgi:hypothetical protein
MIPPEGGFGVRDGPDRERNEQKGRRILSDKAEQGFVWYLGYHDRKGCGYSQSDGNDSK